MSDFNNQNEERYNVFGASNERQKQRTQERQSNIDRYQVYVPDDQYDILNGIISQSDDPVEIENESYRVANALKYSEMYGIDIADAYRDLDNLNAANFGEGAFNTPKDAFCAVVDSFTQGVKQMERNSVGKKIREAEELGNDRYAEELYQTIAGIDEEIAGLQDTQSRNIITTMFKYGAQSLPYTGAAVVTSAVGGLLGGGIGAVVLGTMSSYEAMRGEEYLQLREDGASVETAGRIADCSALVQGVVETSLGTVAGYAGKAAGANPIAKSASDKIAKNVFSRMYYGGAWKKAAAIAGNLGVHTLVEANEEGLEEVIQEIVSSGGRALAAELEGYGIDGLTASEVARNSWESYKGGFLGALVLGAPNTFIDSKATVQDFKDFNSAAQNIDSKEAFIKETSDSPVLDGMSEETKLKAQEEVYDKFEPQRNKKAEERKAMELDRAEVMDTSDNVEETITDESGRVVRDEEYRNEEGGLNYEEKLYDTNEDGSTENLFIVKGKGNQEYGRIMYREDTDGNVTINDFKMSATRENLRQEVYTDFAEKMAGKNIEWETRGKTAASVRDLLAENNIRGKNNGLNYFADKNEVQNQKTRMSWDKQIREAIPSMDAEQRSTGIALVESFANKHGQSISDYDMEIFNGKLFIDKASKEAYESALNQGMNPENIGGYVDIDELGKSTKGIIYAAKKGDATTFVHENAHIFRRLLTAEEMAQAEKLFNVEDHNWTRQNEEDFAYALQGYAFEGKAVGEAKALFDKLAQALVRVINSLKDKIDFNPELSDFIEGLFADPTTALAQAKRAVEQNERASYKQDTKEETVSETESIINDTSADTIDRVEASLDKAINDSIYYQDITLSSKNEIDNEVKKIIDAKDFYYYGIRADKNDIYDVGDEANNSHQWYQDPDYDDDGELIYPEGEGPTKGLYDHGELKGTCAIIIENEEFEDGYPVDGVIDAVFGYNNSENRTVYVLGSDLMGGGEDPGEGIFQEAKVLAKIKENKDGTYTFDGGSVGTLFQYIDVAGTMNLDNRTKNMYDRAEAMREAGESLENIRLLTGYSIGPDGVFQYELDDSKNEIIDREGVQKAINAAQYMNRAMSNPATNAQNLELLQYAMDKQLELMNTTYDTVGKLYKAGELYTAKPELKNIRVGYVYDNRRIRAVQFEGGIGINLAYVSSNEELKGALVHELQHVIDLKASNINYDGDFWTGLYNAMESVEQNNKEYYADLVDDGGIVQYFLTDPYERNAHSAQRRLNLSKAERRAYKPTDVVNNNYLFQSQEDDVRAQYEGTDQWMKAPNGRDTNLTEKQWLQVRTPNFKAWFGDWESDLQNASKVVDENGEPLVVYHGTEHSGFDKFASGNDGYYNTNFFTPNKELAATYSGSIENATYSRNDEYDNGTSGIYGVFINARKLKEVDFNGLDPSGFNENGESVSDLFTDEEGYKAQDEGYDAALLKNVYWDVGSNDENYYGPSLNDEYLVFDTNNIKSATDNNGDFNSDNPSILFQDKEYEVTQEQLDKAKSILSDPSKYSEKERLRIEKNLNDHKGTAYYSYLVYSININDDLEGMIDGKGLSPDSHIARFKTIQRYLKKGEKGLFDYLEYESSILGTPDKCVNAVAGSGRNCNPSEACAKFCYAAKGTGQFANVIMAAEANDIAIKRNYKEAARITAEHYKRTEEGEKNYELRILDRGDLGEYWIPYIKELNDVYGISLCVFSKRGEFLSQLDPNKNVLLLSIDSTNESIAEEYPNLPISLAVKPGEEWLLEKYKDRFLTLNGVILPVKSTEFSKKEKFTFVKSLPKWAVGTKGQKGFVCPIDSGWKEIGNGLGGTWNCTICNKIGWGCYIHRSVSGEKLLSPNIINSTEGEQNAINRNLEAAIRQTFPTASEEQIRQFIENYHAISNPEYGSVESGRSGERISESNGQVPGSSSIQKGPSGVSGRTGTEEVKGQLFQTVYHGSAADFDKFDTENYGLSGEGSMSFGYGTYVTGSEEIAREYAKRQRDFKFGSVESIEEDIKYYEERKSEKEEELKNFPSFEDYMANKKRKIEKLESINEKEGHTEFRDLLLKSYKKSGIESYNEQRNLIETEIDRRNSEINALQEKLKTAKLNESEKRKLYTVEIPDNGFIRWDGKQRQSTVNKIHKSLFEKLAYEPNEYGEYPYKGVEKELKDELNSSFNSYFTGETIYGTVSAYLGSDKRASKFLYDIGYYGIDYPAGTNFGTPDGKEARNYVIFNDEDAKIVDKQLFQYMQNELDDDTLREASMFDSWEEWYEFAKIMDTDGIVTGEWDNVAEQEWFKSAWESSQKIYNPEQNVDPEDEARKDRDFIELIKKPGYLEDFLDRAKYFINSELEQPADEAEAKEFEKLNESKRFAANVMTDPVHYANDLDDTQKKKLLSMIEGSPREYRAIYAEVFNDSTLSVPEGYEYTVDTSTAPEDMQMELDNMTPAQRREAMKAIEDEAIRSQIESGSLPMDETLDRYVKVVNEENRKLKKEIDRLNKEYLKDLENINNAQKKALLEEYNRLQDLAADLQSRNLKGNSRISSGLSAGAMATSNVVDASENGTYNTVMERIASLKKMFAGERDASALVAKADERAKQKVLQNKKKAEAEALKEMKKLRTNAIKRMVRKVSFNNVNYDEAKKIIAIQDFIDHWVRTGVNLWLGETEVTASEIYQKFATDSDFRDEVKKALLDKKAGERGLRVLRNLNEAMLDDEGRTFNQWTTKEKNDLIEVLGMNDQVIRLNLDSLATGRKQAIHNFLDKDGRITEECMQTVYSALPKDVIARIRYVPMKKWTLEQAEELARWIDTIYEEGKLVKAGREQLRRDRYEEIRKRIQDTVKDTGITFGPNDTPEDIKKKREKIEKILGLRTQAKGTSASASEKKSMREKFMAADRGTGNVRRFSRVMDNWSEGVFTDTLCFREYMAYDEEMKAINERSRHVQKYMADNGITMDRLMEKHTFHGLMDGENITLTTDELLYVYIAAQDDMSKEAVMYGNFTTEEEKESVKQHEAKYADKEAIKWFKGNAASRFNKVLARATNLVEQNKDLAGLVEVIENDYEKQYERLNRVSIDVFNMPVNRVEAYVPIYRLSQSGDTNEQQVAKDILANYSGAPSNYVNRGMTKNRIEIGPTNQKPVQMGLFKTWAESMQKTEHFVAYGELVRDLNAIYTSQAASATREAITKRYGQDANNYIKEYINELANPTKGQTKSSLDTLVHVMRGQTAPAYLAWKTSGIIKQLCTSPWPFMAYVTPAEYLVSVGEFITDWNKMNDFVKNRSVFMANRTIDPIIDLIKEAQNKADNKTKAALANFNKIGMQGLEMADWVSVAPGWYAAYKQKVAEIEKAQKFMDPMKDGYKDNEAIETEAIAYADDVVRLTQPSGRSADIAPLFKNSAEIAKVLLQFQTSLNVIYQNIRFDLPYQIKNKQWKQAVGAVIGYTAAGILVNAVVSGGFVTGDGSDDEPEDKLKRAVFYATTQFTDSVPVVGQTLTNTVQKLLTGEGQYSNSTLFPVVDTLTKTVSDISKDNYGKAASDFGQGVAYTLGLPVSGTKELLRMFGIGDNEDGIDFKPEALWGRR